jgi:hypothetical protein
MPKMIARRNAILKEMKRAFLGFEIIIGSVPGIQHLKLQI